jgi:hypothetical protein
MPGKVQVVVLDACFHRLRCFAAFKLQYVMICHCIFVDFFVIDSISVCHSICHPVVLPRSRSGWWLASMCKDNETGNTVMTVSVGTEYLATHVVVILCQYFGMWTFGMYLLV